MDLSIIESLKIEDVKPVEQPVSVSNFIEPTNDEILEIIELFKAGKSVSDVWKVWFRPSGTAKLSLSQAQLKEIYEAWQMQISKLTVDVPEGM